MKSSGATLWNHILEVIKNVIEEESNNSMLLPPTQL